VAANDFWLYQWMDSYLITSLERARALLNKPEPLEALRVTAQEASKSASLGAEEASNRTAIVAGGNLDLSGDISCFHWECQKDQVDQLFSHVWHYFDTIVVVGPSARDYSANWDRYNKDALVRELSHYIRLLLYIRHIGADSLLSFREKPPKCTAHWRKHVQEVGLKGGLPEANRLIRLLADEAEYEIDDTPYEDHYHVSLWHPYLLARYRSRVTLQKREISPSDRRKVAEGAVAFLSAQLVSDVEAAKELHAPLGSDFFLHREMLRRARKRATEADVAFHLRLPVLEGIEPELLLRIRHDEQEPFDAFRNNLRVAIRERLNRADAPEASAIALEIKRDVIDPALNDIERRLKAARQLLSKKGGLSSGPWCLGNHLWLVNRKPGNHWRWSHSDGNQP
jgi:hypothetical protein